MKEIFVTVDGMALDFDTARDIARTLALKMNPHTDEMAWFNRRANQFSPSGIMCRFGDTPGWEQYGKTHGGQRKISVNSGEYVFIFT
ncbi:MAG TPA: hypothetical protein EYP57_07240 [Thermodesulfobacteriaceae bacterium]|nr:hypothetical protein [Thermodesulfobacteriaceae bacterium]